MFCSEWYMEWFLAITFVGGIVAPLNPRWVCMFNVIINMEKKEHKSIFLMKKIM